MLRPTWPLFLLLVLLGCEADGTDDAGAVDGGSDAGGAVDAHVPLPRPAADYFEEGPFPVGNVRVSLTDAARSRTLPVEIWYPADASARADANAGQPIAAFEREDPRDDAFAALLADAPDCVRTQTRAADAPDPESSGDRWPLVVFSHCHVCTRFDVASVAERLAGFGIAVAAPDHEENTLWDELDGDAAAVGSEFLEVRVGDVSFVLDRLLAGDDALPTELRARFDAARVGVMGHSFGAATAGIAAARDDRILAGLAMAAPLTALGGGARINTIDTPFLFLVAKEDNSIGEAGNGLIRSEHRRIGSDSLLVEVADAGHWSFSDYPGLTDFFAAGCGMGERQTDGEAFTYVDPDTAREIAGDVAVAWFAQHLLADPGGSTPILEGHPSGLVEASLN
ncbi:MAG: alpha/beta hydrolase family protein [Sandaracinaceae bacterium]